MHSTPSLPPARGYGEIAVRGRPVETALPLSRTYEPPPPSDWQRYLVAVARHKWLVLCFALLGIGGGVVASWYLAPRYSAKAMLWIQSTGHDRGADPLTGDEVVAGSSWSQLVTSNAVLDSAVSTLRLYVTPKHRADSAVFAGFEIRRGFQPGGYRLKVDRGGTGFQLQLKDGTVVQRGAVGDSVGRAVGFAWAPPPAALTPGRRIDFALSAPYEAALKLAKDLKVRLDPGGSLLRVELKGTSPWLTAAAVNAVADQTVTIAAELKRQKLAELEKILGGHY